MWSTLSCSASINRVRSTFHANTSQQPEYLPRFSATILAATIELKRDVPERTREILAALPGIVVRSSRSRTALRVDGNSWDLALVDGGPGSYVMATTPMPVAPAREALKFVVAERLPVRIRSELEKAGFAYADGTGAAHIELPGFYPHIEAAAAAYEKAVDVVELRDDPTEVSDVYEHVSDCFASHPDVPTTLRGPRTRVRVSRGPDGSVVVRATTFRRRRRAVVRDIRLGSSTSDRRRLQFSVTGKAEIELAYFSDRRVAFSSKFYPANFPRALSSWLFAGV